MSALDNPEFFLGEFFEWSTNVAPNFDKLKNFRYPTHEQIAESAYFLLHLNQWRNIDNIYKISMVSIRNEFVSSRYIFKGIATLRDIEKLLAAYLRHRLTVKMRVDACHALASVNHDPYEHYDLNVFFNINELGSPFEPY